MSEDFSRSNKIMLSLLGLTLVIFLVFLLIRVGALAVDTSLVQRFITSDDFPMLDVPTPPAGAPVAWGGDKLAVYAGPSKQYPQTGWLLKEQRAEVIGASPDGQWLAIKAPAIENDMGWVSVGAIQGENIAGLQVLGGADAALEAPGAPAVTAITDASIMSGPGWNYTTLGTLSNGQKAELMGSSADRSWWAVSVPSGQQGWVSAGQVITQNAEAVSVVSGQSGQAAATPTIPEEDLPMAIAKANINIRNGPGTNFAQIGTLAAGQQAEIIGIDPTGSWLAIKVPTAGDGYGWVSGEFVDGKNTENLPVADQDLIRQAVGLPTMAPGRAKLTTLTVVNVRTGPGTGFDLLVTLERGQIADVTGVTPDGQWWRIVLPGTETAEGWVAAPYVSVENGGSVTIVK